MEVLDERSFSCAVLSEEDDGRLCFDVAVAQQRRVELVKLVQLLHYDESDGESQ